MNRLTVVGILLLAALLEAGGDALVRIGLKHHQANARWASFLIGAVVLFLYGVVVNAPSWDFGKLLGIYVVFFFVTAQVISAAVFHQKPDMATLLGGALIVAGGVVMTAM